MGQPLSSVPPIGERPIASMPPFQRVTRRLLGSLRLGRALRLVWEASPLWSVLNLVLVAVQAAVPVAVLYLTKLVVDTVAAGVAGDGGEGLERALVLIALAAAAGLIGSAAASLSAVVGEAQGHAVTDHVLTVLHRKSVEVDLAYYEDPSYHDSLHRAQQEAPYRPTRVLGGISGVIQSGLTAVGIVALLATVHWLLAILLFAAVLPALAVRIRYADRAYRWHELRAGLERKANYLSWLLVTPGPAKEVRAFGLGETLIRRFADLRDRLREEKISLARSRSLGEILAQTLAALAVFGAYAFVAFRTLEGALTIGDLVMYFGAVQKGQSLLQSLFGSLGSLYEDNLFLATLEEFLELEPSVVEPAAPAVFPRPMREGVRFEAVSFRYPGGSRPLLEDVNLVLPPGEVVALVGPNGAGKSTIVKLLQRMYDPTAGRITIDGIDLRQLRSSDIRREMSVVFQDYMHYFLTARDNVWFGDVERTADGGGIAHAAELAGADRAIRGLPHGYDTTLGRLFPEGEELSIGEWQKVALARAFFRNAQLLIVDEPTSALDADAEAELFTALRELLRGRSALLISHRFSTLRMADRIHVLDGGRIVESGSHAELLRRGGRYARLYRVQAASYTDGDVGPSASLR